MRDNQEIFDLLNEAAAKGQKLPSLRAIRAKIGGGSLTRISEAVKAWQTQKLVDKGQLPKEFTDAEKEKIINTIWSVVQPIMGRRIEQLLEYHMARVTISLGTSRRLHQEAEKMLEEATERKLEYESKLREKDERINKEVADKSAYVTLLSSMRGENTALKKEIERLQKEREELLKQNAALTAENALLRRS